MRIQSSHLAFFSIVSGLALSGSAVGSCVIANIRNCCDTLGLNTTRVCGFLRDQDCPDEVITNPSFYDSTTVLNGHQPGSSGSSVLCVYKTGRCTGLFGNNLCEMSGEKTHECVNEPAGQAGCTTKTVTQ